MREVKTLRVLWMKWVSLDGPIDVQRLQQVIKREVHLAETGRIKVSNGLLTEIRNERAIIGRLVNAQKE